VPDDDHSMAFQLMQENGEAAGEFWVMAQGDLGDPSISLSNFSMRRVRGA
jgi:hypothetical protein